MPGHWTAYCIIIRVECWLGYFHSELYGRNFGSTSKSTSAWGCDGERESNNVVTLSRVKVIYLNICHMSHYLTPSWLHFYLIVSQQAQLGCQDPAQATKRIKKHSPCLFLRLVQQSRTAHSKVLQIWGIGLRQTVCLLQIAMDFISKLAWNTSVVITAQSVSKFP